MSGERTLRVGTCGDYKPFTYRDARGAYEGLDIDAAHALAASLAVRVAFVATSWPALLDDLLAGRFDLAVGGISKNAERERRALLSRSYFEDGKVPLVRAADVERFARFEEIDRPAVRVAVNPGGTNARFVEDRVRRAQVIVVADNLAIPQMLARGDADVMITDAVEARLAAKADRRLAALEVEPFTKEERVYLLPPGGEALLASVNAWIARALDDGTYARLRARWLP